MSAGIFRGARPSRVWVKASRFHELLSLKIVSARRRNPRPRRARSPESRVRRIWICSTACLCMVGVWLAMPKPPLLDGISFSQCVRDRNGKLLRITLTVDQKFRVKTPLRDVSPELIKATLRYEDKYYARHPGVNPVALGRCVFEFVRSRRVIAGGSTISMQVARLRFH